MMSLFLFLHDAPPIWVYLNLNTLSMPEALPNWFAKHTVQAVSVKNRGSHFGNRSLPFTALLAYIKFRQCPYPDRGVVFPSPFFLYRQSLNTSKYTTWPRGRAAHHRPALGSHHYTTQWFLYGRVTTARHCLVQAMLVPVLMVNVHGSHVFISRGYLLYLFHLLTYSSYNFT
jgi:hypothetical protein